MAKMIVLQKPKNYDETPWEIPFAQRMCHIREAIRQGRKIAIHFYEKADTSTFRYRCYNVMQALKLGDAWASVYFFEDELEKIYPILPHIHLPILVRMLWTVELANFVSILRSMGLPVLYDMDDRVFDLDMLPQVCNTLNTLVHDRASYDDWFALISRHQTAAGLADAFTTTNSFLGEALQSKFGKPYGIISNSLNQEQLTISEQFSQEKQKRSSQKPFCLGYFSGSPTHINDFKCIYKEVMALMNKYPEIVLRVVGFMDFPSDMQPLIDSGRVIRIPLVDFIELQWQVAQVDVNLVPLVQNDFTNCKSELKFFEAAIVDTLTVATPTYAFKNCICHGENGFLCQPGEWYDTLEHIYNNKETINSIVARAKKDVIKTYSPQFQMERMVSTYNNLYEIVSA